MAGEGAAWERGRIFARIFYPLRAIFELASILLIKYTKTGFLGGGACYDLVQHRALAAHAHQSSTTRKEGL
jgi:hypothetical protein